MDRPALQQPVTPKSPEGQRTGRPRCPETGRWILPRALGLLLAALLLLAMVSCGGHGGGEKGEKGEGQKGTAAPAAPAPLVQVVKVAAASVPITGTYPAQTVASTTVQLRPRVEGYLLNFTFKEGYPVTAGQVLFQIDPAPYEAALQTAVATKAKAQADVERARADRAKAEADLVYALKQVNLLKARAELAAAMTGLKKADEDVARYRPLAKLEAVPQQTLDYALAAQAEGRAQVAAARATLTNTRLKDQADIQRARAAVSTALASEQAAVAAVQAAEGEIQTARLNLGFCTISSPVSGTIGRVAVNPGNLVGRGENTVLATIDVEDPIYVDFTISEVDWLGVVRSGPRKGPTGFDLILADGSTYQRQGKFLLVERGLDPKTGTMLIRTRFPNPRHELRSGQFARIRTVTTVQKEALVVPQRSVQEYQSLQTVFVVGDDGKVVRRTVVLGDTVEKGFVIKQGLKEGEMVIVEGLQKVRPGLQVKTEVVPMPTGRP